MKGLLLSLFLLLAFAATADDGCRLWLRFPDQPQPQTCVSLSTDSPFTPAEEAILSTAIDELRQHWQGLPLYLHLANDTTLCRDAFHIARSDDEESFIITTSSATGMLYAAYFVLRSQTMGDGCLCQTLGPSHELTEQPDMAIRSVAVGNTSLLEGRVTTFARAMASTGINEVVLPANGFHGIGSFADSLSAYSITVRCSDPTDDPLPLTSDSNWTGNPLRQVDLYTAGRRQWKSDIPRERIVCEWLAQTFSENPYFIISMRDAMLCDEVTNRVAKLFDTWQEMRPYIDRQRYEEVEMYLMEQLSDEK